MFTSFRCGDVVGCGAWCTRCEITKHGPHFPGNVQYIIKANNGKFRTVFLSRGKSSGKTMSTTHDWESFIACYTTYKNGDDWGMVSFMALF